MANNLIENTTNVFWTVELQGELYVKDYSIYGGKIEKVDIVRGEKDACTFNNSEMAVKVAYFANGKVIKHTRTKVITEVTEEFEVI